MKILYAAFVRLPTEKAHGVQIMKTCEALASEGVDVELMVPNRKTPILEEPFSYYGVTKNFTLTTVSSLDWVSKGAFGFILSMLWFSEKVKFKKSFWDADVIYSRDAGLLLQYIFLGRKLVYEAHTKPTALSKFVAKRAYALIVISDSLKTAYIKAGVRPEKITVAYDAVDPFAFKERFKQKDARDWLKIRTDGSVALYAGRIDKSKGADTFAAASEHLSDATCVLIGSGPLAGELKQKYPKAIFLPETLYKDLPQTLSAADVLVIPNSARSEDSSKYTSPLKAFAYLASGKNIVSSNVVALTNIFKDGATYFEADNPESCADAIRTALKKENVPLEEIYTWQDRVEAILEKIKNNTTLPSDNMLRADVEYYDPPKGKSSDMYYVYPSIKAPQYIIPVDDIFAQRFFISNLSSDAGTGGVVLRVLLALPGVTRLVSSVVFTRSTF